MEPDPAISALQEPTKPTTHIKNFLNKPMVSQLVYKFRPWTSRSDKDTQGVRITAVSHN